MSSPVDPQNPPPLSPKDPNFRQQNQNQPQPDDPQSPKTLTMEIPDNEDDLNPNSIPDDPNQSDPDEITHLSPTISDCHVSSSTTTTTTTAAVSFTRRGGNAKRKKRRGGGLQGKKSQQKLDNLVKSLNLVPFIPVKTLDFDSHESLLRRLGLWDFVHLQFDVNNLRSDLIAQLIAHFSPQNRCSYVNTVRIKVSRPDLARALQLPVKKDKVENALEDKESKESIEFIEEFVSTWLLLHEDTWMMTDDILGVIKLIKDGNFEKVDWAKLIWLMVEKELAAAPNLGNCYYASHLQLLIKSQKDEMFKEEFGKMDIDIKEEDEEEEDVKLSEEIHGVELEEHNIELSLGGLDNAVKNDADVDEKDGKEEVAGDAFTMDYEESKEDEEQGQWLKSSMDGHFLQPCNRGEVGYVEPEVAMKQEERAGDEEGKEGNGGEGEDVEDDEEEGEEEEEEEMGFSISPKGDSLEGVCPENLIAALEASQTPFNAGMPIRDNMTSGGFLSSRVDAHSIPGSSSLFNNGNGNKRGIENLDNDIPHQLLNSSNKRMRNDGPWDTKPASDLHMIFDQMEHNMGQMKMVCEAKEHEYQEMSIHRQMLMSELQQRENIIQLLHKEKMEEQQKRQLETYRLERELYMMASLLEGYRKALKQTHKAFAEYRAKFSLPEEPIYKDTGSGGLVLSTTELEKLRLKQEEELRLKRLVAEKTAKDYEAASVAKFESYKDRLEQMSSKLPDLREQINLLKEEFRKRKVSEKAESAPAEESITKEPV